MRNTHTFAYLDLSPEAFAEIKAKLEAAGYQDAFHDVGTTIDMHGIAVRADSPRPPERNLMIKPTVGRVVWFYVYSPGNGHKGPLIGHVCKVHSDRHVNLSVIGEDGRQRPELTVPLVQDNEDCPAADYCCWMPFQKGQAAKTEDETAKLAHRVGELEQWRNDPLRA